jgi:Penicillinase repressor
VVQSAPQPAGHGDAGPAAGVRDRLSSGLAYTTVVTILSRLHAKGVLDRRKTGRAFVYRPVADEPGLAARRPAQMLDAEPDREAVLARFPDRHRLRRHFLTGNGPGCPHSPGPRCGSAASPARAGGLRGGDGGGRLASAVGGERPGAGSCRSVPGRSACNVCYFRWRGSR